MKRFFKLIFFVILISSCSHLFSRFFVKPNSSDSLLYLMRKMGRTLDEVRYSIGEIVTESTTIDASGFYILGDNIDGTITVDADDVWLDLNNFYIHDDTGTSPGIKINSGYKNVKIKNGALQGTGSSGNSYNGILIENGSSLVDIEKIKVFDFGNGIYFDGTSTATIADCNVKNCTIMDCQKGIVANYTIKNSFKRCNVKNCSQGGFLFYKSNFTLCEKCKALEITNDDSSQSATGFSSTSGQGTLFVECVAEGIEKTSSDFCKNATGFLFDGTETLAGETESKIINCIVNSTKITGTGNAYGIHLDMVLRDTNSFDVLESPVATTEHGAALFTVGWSPVSKFVAVAGADSGGNYLRVYQFDGTQLTTVVSKNINGKTVRTLSWSPDAKFLAVGTEVVEKEFELVVYRFDTGDSNILVPYSSVSFSDVVYSLVWSPDAKLLAVGLGVAESNEIQVWEFDGAELSLSAVGTYATSAAVYGLDFSPDGNFLGAVYSDTVHMFEVDRDSATNVITSKVSTSVTSAATVRSIHFSPIAISAHPEPVEGKYFPVVGGDRGNSITVEVFEYDGATSISSFETEDHGNDLNSVVWSPNGKYLLVAGDTSGGYEMCIYQFDASALSGSRLQLQGSGSFPGGNANSADWSPSGRYVAVVGQTTGGDDVAIFEVSHVPTKCKIENNNICNTNGGLCGIGLEGASGENLIIKNICYESDVNFSSGVCNVFRGGVDGSPTNIENISVPPYAGGQLDNLDRLQNIENKIDTVSSKVDVFFTFASRVDFISDCCITSDSKVDEIISQIFTVDSKVDVLPESGFTLNSKVDDIILLKLTLDSKVDQLVESCNTVDSKIDLINVNDNLTTIGSKVDTVSVCCPAVASKLDVIDAKVIERIVPFSCISTSTTITSPGFYKLCSNIKGFVIVDSDSVHFDLNGFEIYDTDGTGTTLQVNQNHKNVVLKNGFIRNAFDGVLVEQGASSVNISALHVLDCQHGINLDGSSTGTVKCCVVKDCILYANGKGVRLEHAIKNSFEYCQACNCSESGFELEDSWYNVFEKCKALETSNGDLEKSAVGFKSTSGRGNLFTECVAEGTTKTAGNFGFNAAGFLLTGSDNKAGETETKIINCFVDSTDTTLTGSCVAYGVQLDMILKPNSLDASRVAVQGTKSSDQWAVSWSKVADYIAVGGNDNVVNVYFFDGSSLTTVASVSGLPADVRAVEWSPRGNFLAVGLLSNGTGEVLVYRFDPLADSSSRLSLVDSLNLGGAAYGLSWSPDGRYLSMVLDGSDSLEVRVFIFDGVNGFGSLLGSATLGVTITTQKISFSPDGKILLFSDTGTADLFVYRFDPALAPNALQLAASKDLAALSFSFPTIARFSPISFGGKYFILVGDPTTPGKIGVFSFDGQSIISGPLDTKDHGGDIFDLRWSPNGKYIILVGGAGTGGFEIRVFSFDGSQLTLEASGDHPLYALSVDWSPSGNYVVATGAPVANNIQIFDVANVCSKNVIENKKISNCQGGLGGIGIEGASATNLIIKNIGYENGVNFSAGVFNQYIDGLNGSQENGLENISIPPYFS